MGGNEALRGVASDAQVVAHPAEERFFHDIAAHTRSYRDLVAEVPAFAALATAYTGQFADNITLPAHVDVWLTAGRRLISAAASSCRPSTCPDTPAASWGTGGRSAGCCLPAMVFRGLGSQVGSFPLVFASAADYRASLARIIELEPAALCMGHAFLDRAGRQAADAARTDRDALLAGEFWRSPITWPT